MKYLLLLCGQPHDREAWETLPDETRAQHYIRVGQWFADKSCKNTATCNSRIPALSQHDRW
jgi:hypothetical protein